MKKIIKSRIVNFLELNNYLDKNQYGFQVNKTTSDAILHLAEIITKNFDDSKKKTLGVFLDLAKAFDTVPHERLLRKLESCGIRGVTNKLFASYLEDRTQILTLNGVTDIKVNSNFGLPQGTVLSPILFLIYVNDLLKIKIHDCTILSFADDTALLFSGESWEEAFRNANGGLAIVKSWLDINILTLNANKTKYITFSPTESGQPKGTGPFELLIQSQEIGNQSNFDFTKIEKVDTVKYLGIQLDKHMKWTAHLNYVCSKLKYLIYIFYKINKIKDLSIIRKIYFAYAHSIFQYAIEVWGAAYDTHFNKLFTLQKHLLRAALGRPRLYPSKMLFIELNVLTLRQIYLLKIIKYINKNRYLFFLRNINYSTRPAFTNVYISDLTRLSTARRQFRYYSNILINKIPSKFVSDKITKSLVKDVAEWVKKECYFKLPYLD